MNAVKTAQVHSWWYEEIGRIDPALRNSDPPPVYISVVNKVSQRLISSLTLYMRPLQSLVAQVQQWYTAARPQSTLLTDFKPSRLQQSGKW
jgi:hypothetical protein